MGPLPRSALSGAAALAACLIAACLTTACSSAPERGSGRPGDAARPALDRALARSAARGDWDRTMRLADSARAYGAPGEKEIALYWKAVAWLYRSEPDSALALLESQQGHWTAGSLKVHGALLYKLVRETCAARPVAHNRPEEPDPRPALVERALQDRLDALERERTDLRAENLRLETEKEKYQKLLKDLETIR
jgi:hypothetical protein